MKRYLIFTLAALLLMLIYICYFNERVSSEKLHRVTVNEEFYKLSGCFERLSVSKSNLVHGLYVEGPLLPDHIEFVDINNRIFYVKRLGSQTEIDFEQGSNAVVQVALTRCAAR